MKNELPLSTEHRLLCYGDDSFNDAIAFSEEYISETLAVISDISFNGVKIDNLETSQKECENILLEVKNGDIYGYANLYCHPLRAAITLDASNKIDLSFKVNKHIPLNSWSCIAAYIMPCQDKKVFEKSNSHLHMFGRYSKRGFFYNHNGDCELLLVESDVLLKPYYIRIYNKEHTIIFSASSDSVNWFQLCTKDNIYTDNCKCGILLDFGEAEYYNWLYSRHIQIFCEKNIIGSRKPIDYFYFDSFDCIEKNNPHVKQFCIPKRLVPSDTEENLCRFITEAINNKQYVDLCLDEYYIEGRSAYAKYSFMHYNMLYGYDDVKMSCKILGYNQDQKLSISETSVHDIYQAFVNASNSDVFLRQYNTNDYIEKLDYKMIISEIDDYLNGVDSAARYPYACKERTSYCFGISIYDLLLDNKENLAYMAKDLRIPYFILEHKKLLKDRVVFLTYRLKFDNLTAKALIDLCDTLLKEANIVLMLSIKAQIKKAANCEIRGLTKHVKQLRETERILLMKLYFKLVKAVNYYDEKPY